METAVARMFAPARRPGRVGAEVELIPVGPGLGPVDPATWMFPPAFAAAARPSFEPGGQLELSPPPRPDAASLAVTLERLVRAADRLAAASGVRLEAVGTDPYRGCADVPLRTPTPRYRAMQAAFDEVGPDGRRMMRLTASLQVAVDILPGPAGREQWLVANLAGPPLAAAFANSTAIDGRPTGVDGARTRVWRGVDPRRTGYDGRHLDPRDPIGAYTAFAAAAPRLALPEAADDAYHLSTLFPPVRPRGGYLEVRYLDAQPPERMGAAIASVATLLYDQRARRDAIDLLLPRVGDQDRAWAETAAGFSPQSADLMAIVGRTADNAVGAR